VAILIGNTGFVGGHLSEGFTFTDFFHRENIESITGHDTELLVCAGLPAEKWRANNDPCSDWKNMATLAHSLLEVRARRAVLISTIDVFQPCIGVDETSSPLLVGGEAYGAHRSWFEVFFKSQFKESLVLRLPALFGPNLKKNLVFDLLHERTDQYQNINPNTTFQFFDVTKLWDVIRIAWQNKISILNVTSEPVSAQEIALLFEASLGSSSPPKHYDMKSMYAPLFGGKNGYLYGKEEVLGGIQDLRETEVE
jgi:nucleoside-diphosphate-sugar epimerase